MGALLANLVVRERASRGGRVESLKGPKRSFEVSGETAQALKMSIDARSSYGFSQQHLNPQPFGGVVRKQVPPPPPPPPPPLAAPIMINYLKLDAPKYKERDDPFKYVRAIKMIADKLDANDSRAIQMASLTLKCKKVKECYKSYVEYKKSRRVCTASENSSSDAEGASILNLKQKRWVQYHPKEANIITDGLSQKSFSSLAHISI
ncbi:hypothetical protein P3X46_035205 [Hevea brasiliensis]|uniref:Uncharacterized protein n=1 Tax=Hevea brasiliensis TaxID=3981 RepID=A0ABQ9KBI7_HEVBR|nr:hypothetical protein P3X46_035205 [Hevea brasiliensis]